MPKKRSKLKINGTSFIFFLVFSLKESVIYSIEAFFAIIKQNQIEN